MTFEEARKILERELLAVTLESNALKKEAQKKRLNEKFAALNVALKAIDKQIPRKPIEKSPWVYRCPNCDSQIIEEVFLDWSETDD